MKITETTKIMMTENKKIIHILYVGSDHGFHHSLYHFFQQDPGHELHKVTTLEDNFLNHYFFQSLLNRVFVDCPHLIYFDFENLPSVPAIPSVIDENILEIFHTLSASLLFKNTSIIGLFKSKEQLDHLKFFFTVGLKFSFIKGSNGDQLPNLLNFHDQCSQLAGLTIPQGWELSPSHQLKFSSQFKNLSRLESISSSAETLTLLTNIPARKSPQRSIIQQVYDESESKVAADLHLFPDFLPKKFEVKERSSLLHELIGPYSQRVQLKIPYYQGTVEDQDEVYFFQETMSTWLESSQKHFDQRKNHLFIFGLQQNYLKELIPFSFPSPYFIHAIDLQQTKEGSLYFAIIKKMKCQLIIYRLNSSEDFASFIKFIEFVRPQQKYQPSFIIFNNPSSSEAIRKVCQYHKIVSTNEDISKKLLTKLIGKFTGFKKSDLNQDFSGTGDYYFKKNDPRAIAEVPFDVTITSFNKQEITFTTTMPLPLHSVFHLDHPFHTYLTLVEKLKNEREFHYKGFIHGATE